jgi:thioredoxin 1
LGLFSYLCSPCGILALTISSLADKFAGRVTVCKVDVDRIPTVAQRYGVRAIPTVLIIKNGKEIKRLVGLQPEAEYVALLENLLGEAGD